MHPTIQGVLRLGMLQYTFALNARPTAPWRNDNIRKYIRGIDIETVCKHRQSVYCTGGQLSKCSVKTRPVGSVEMYRPDSPQQKIIISPSPQWHLLAEPRHNCNRHTQQKRRCEMRNGSGCMFHDCWNPISQQQQYNNHNNNNDNSNNDDNNHNTSHKAPTAATHDGVRKCSKYFVLAVNNR